MKILEILEYFFDYKQDKLFANVRRVFLRMVQEAELVKLYKEDVLNSDTRKERISSALSHYMKYILPRIMLSGTEIDREEPGFGEEITDDILDINEILQYEILPVLVQQLSLNNNKGFEKKVLQVMLKIYNQRQEFVNSAKSLMLLFEKSDITNFLEAKKFAKELGRYSEESEVIFNFYNK